MVQTLTVTGGTLAYEVQGAGPLVVLAHGMGDSRDAYSSMTPALVAAGYRVAAVDLRGCGDSSVGWDSYTRTAIAGDLVALVTHLGGPATIVGHSIAGGAVTIAAATAPELVSGVVELAPFTRKQQIRLSDFGTSTYRRGATALMGATMLGSKKQWGRYLELAYPGRKPADWQARSARMVAKLGEPGRMAVLKKMGTLPPVDAGEALPEVTCPVLVIQGSADPDWVSPAAEGKAIVGDLRPGLGRLVVIDGAGHYPHVQYPEQTLDAVLPFLREVAPVDGASRA
ncbi:alpha/beta hydrolase [Curtobacterium sp. Leaf183]|uniref:alpha/beta fold hydrolase n=1 Tax=Curtobacterium sp. Leaf183 TaxID=1736291 RepID=UPI0006F89212|nr:alpha/beta hydrolase [Curtobacterium sp. Leaf183]KQS08979.1 alpha/beta hydrolase [Curtobacterium sp. Leaf183]